jgi:hypothetical protein
LLVTVVAALLGSLLLPQITRKWQDHQQALDIRTGLVTQMSESSSTTLATTRFLAAKLVPDAKVQPIYNGAYREWAADSASIGARLQVYTRPPIGDRWRQFGFVLTAALSLAIDTPATHAGRLEEIQRRLPQGLRLTQAEHDALLKANTEDAFQDAFAHLAQNIVVWRDELVREVIHSPVSGF